MPRRSRFLVLALLTTAPACHDGPPPTGPGSPPPDGPAAEQLARSIARAMAAPAVRSRVFADLRASPWTEHKLDLRGYLGSAAGRLLTAAAGRALGEGGGGVLQLAGAVPPSDFGIPNGADRRRWRGGGDYVVALLPRSDTAPVVAFDSAGTRLTLRHRDALGGRVLFLVQPAERKHLRWGGPEAFPGAGIEAPGGPGLGGSVVLVGPAGDSTEFDLAHAGPDLVMQCPDGDPCTGSGGGGGSGDMGSEGVTYVDRIATEHVCDNGGLICGDNEFEITARYTYGAVIQSSTLRITGVPPTADLRGLRRYLIGHLPLFGSRIQIVQIRETDDFGDDIYHILPHDIPPGGVSGQYTTFYQTGCVGLTCPIPLVVGYLW